MFGTAFVQYLNSQQEYEPVLAAQAPALLNDYSHLLKFSNDVFSLGYDADLVDVRGRGFDTQGRRDRAWFFVSDEAFGSDIGFTQAYFSTRRVYRRGERFKVLLRGEIGYTDAKVENLTIDVGGLPMDLSVTHLPNFYRFKAGGSQSVRGYGFETLNNNDVGSNNIFTASVEAEMLIRNNWAVAAFFDIGNAFNDWDNPDLYKGIGLGVRWYSIAGPIRIDIAQALDFEDKPWQLHFTIGTPLL
jgi:translocation and assembly module TamA